MKLGLTYDLRGEAPEHAQLGGAPSDYDAEFDTPETIAALEAGLRCLGHEVTAIGNVRRLLAFIYEGRAENLELVFNIAEGRGGRAREAQVPALLEAFELPYTGADPLTLAVGLDKPLAKKIWLADGLPTAPHVVVGTLQDLEALTLPPGPYFVKPAHEGASKGIGSDAVAESEAELRERAQTLLARYRQPVLVESYLPGREFTVGVLGQGAGAQVLGMVEVQAVSAGAISGFDDKERWEDINPDYYRPLSSGSLELALSDLALRAYRSLGCRDVGRVDIRLDARGEPQLLELNPLPALNPTHSALPIIAHQAGLTYEALLGKILEQARSRLPGLREAA